MLKNIFKKDSNQNLLWVCLIVFVMSSSVWGQVGVQKDLRIGKGTVVLGQSGIGKTLPPNKVFFGSPVREAKEKMSELAYMKRLPELLDQLNNK